MARGLLKQGRDPEVRERAAQTLQWAEAQHWLLSIALDHLPLGLLARADLHIFTGAFAAAHRDLAEALTLATRCGFRLHAADAHLAYARLHLAEASSAAIREHLGQARALIQATGYHRRDEELARLEASFA